MNRQTQLLSAPPSPVRHAPLAASAGGSPAVFPWENATSARRMGTRNGSARATWHLPRHKTGYVLDASVVSRTWSYKNDPSIRTWIATFPAGALHVPAVAMKVIAHGIDLERDSEPEHARELEAWTDSLPSLGLTFVLPSEAITDVALGLGRIPRLRHLWERCPQHEIYVVATSIASGLKIATLSSKPYRAFSEAGIVMPGFAVLGHQAISSATPDTRLDDGIKDHPIRF
jgi:predicted nucleic acid-binding protein